MSLRPASYQEALERKRAADARRRVRQGDSSFRSLNATQGLKAKKGHGLRANPDPQMAVWGRAIRERDGNRCQWPSGCQTGDMRIDPHHIAKRSQRPDLKYDPVNGICLCRTHHEWTDENPAEARELGLLSTETYEAALKSPLHV